MPVKVLVEAKCADCDKKIRTTAEITASIGNGGRIDVELKPDLVAGWWHSYRGVLCPDHAKEPW